MARWKLTAAHYLNVPGTEVEFKETNRDTGRQARKLYEVPLLLNPEDPADHNYPGEIIVAQGTAQGKDILFVGEPTPDMEPLDEEARKISDSLRPKWAHPIESMPANGETYSEALLRTFTTQVTRAMSGQPVQPTSAPGIDPAAFAELQRQVTELQKINKGLMAKRI